jgi:hypothetical protein
MARASNSARIARLDVDLRHHGAGRDQLAALRGPVRQAHAEADDEIALRDQLVRRRRGKAAADADRPRVAGKQPMPADRGGQQRAGAFGQRDQCRFRPRKHCAATGENEWALGTRKRIRQPAHALGIGMHRPWGRRQRERGGLAGKRGVLHIGRQAQHDRLAVA